MPDPARNALVSIVSPTLNQGRFIEATLRSVMRQTYGPIEHIVIDGGSTDETIDILKRYETRYSMRWLSASDSGMYEAVNRGLRLASGEVLAYLNTDDLYLPWTVATAVRALADDQAADLVYGDVVKVREPDGSCQLVFAPPPSRVYLLRVGSLFQPTVFWRRRLYDAIGGFDDDLAGGADLDYWIRAMQDHRLVKVNEVLAVERLHARTKSASAAEQLALEERAIRARHGASVPWQILSSLVERARTWAIRRAYWIRFSASLRQGRGSDWAAFRSAARPKIKPLALALSQLPIIGARHAASALELRDRASLGLN